ncbi:hypothetical protein HDK64DRAFT_149917 [Phyllosticta capitalensis]
MALYQTWSEQQVRLSSMGSLLSDSAKPGQLRSTPGIPTCSDRPRRLLPLQLSHRTPPRATTHHFASQRATRHCKLCWISSLRPTDHASRIRPWQRASPLKMSGRVMMSRRERRQKLLQTPQRRSEQAERWKEQRSDSRLPILPRGKEMSQMDGGTSRCLLSLTSNPLPKQETIESLSQFLREALTRQSGVMVEGFVHMTILLFFVVVVFFIKSRVATWTIPHHHISQPAKSQSPLHSIFLLVNISSILTTI